MSAYGNGVRILIPITDGLSEGDQIILSDMSRWDAFSRVALR